MAPIEYRRIRQKVDTYDNWMANPLILGDGEQAFVRNGGVVLNFRMGDGTKRFSELTNVIQYDQAAYVAPVGNTLPVPQNGVGYSILTEGSYNGGAIVVPAGNLGIASYSGSWAVRNMELPVRGLILTANAKENWLINEPCRLDDGTLLVANKNTSQAPSKDSIDWDIVGGEEFDSVVEKALGGSPGITTYRNPALSNPITSSPADQYIFLNYSLITPNENGSVKSIFFRSPVAQERVFYILEKISDRDFKVLSRINKNVSVGQNEISLDGVSYSGQITVGVSNIGGVYFEDGSFQNTYYFIVITGGIAEVGSTYNFSPSSGGSGWMDLGFSTETTGAPSGDDFLKKTWSFVNTPQASGGGSVDRVTLAGQSNAYGVAALSELSEPIFAQNEIDWSGRFNRVFIWDKFVGAYVRLQIGVTNMASWDGRYAHPNGGVSPFPTFGPEIGIAISWLHGNKSGQLYIHKDLGDGRPISYFQKGGAAYSDFSTQYDAGDKWLADRGLGASPLGFVWVQGENDNGQSQAYYQNELKTLIDSYSEDGFIKPYSKIAIALINPQNGGYSAAINAAKIAYAATNPNAQTIEYTNNMNPDNVHLNALGSILLGIDAGTIVNRVDPLTAEQMYTLPNYTD